MFLPVATSRSSRNVLPDLRNAINARMGTALESSVAHPVHLGCLLELRFTHLIDERHDAFFG